MNDTVDLKEYKQSKEPHCSGVAKCLVCHHEWVAVAPVGTIELECPKCECVRGFYKYAFGPHENDSIYTCKCGSEVFSFIFRKNFHRMICKNCGRDHNAREFVND